MNRSKRKSEVPSTLAVFTLTLFLASMTPAADVQPVRGLRQVSHSDVELQGGFWGPRQDTSRKVTVPHALDCLEKDGHVTNFDKAAGTFDGPLKGHHAFDSDIYKALEGALYCLQHNEDEPLRQRVESIVDRIIAAQQDDGFLISYYIVKDQGKRWENMRLEHQTYNAGHFFEMAVEHKRLTGQDKALNAAKKFADHIDGIFGPGKRYDVGGHEEIELALVKLYRATGDRKYLDLTKFFLDERGYAHGMERKPFDPNTQPPFPPNLDHLPESERRRAYRRARNSIRNGRMQDHKPLVEQNAIGHAVRAAYYSWANRERGAMTVWVNEDQAQTLPDKGTPDTAPVLDADFDVPTARSHKVFILAGQSNMEGACNIRTIDFLGEDKEHGYLLKKFKPDGKTPVKRDDVWVANRCEYGKLAPGYGARRRSGLGSNIGPKYAFGYFMGEKLKEQVLIIKYAEGGRSLYTNFRPPSAGLPEGSDQKKYGHDYLNLVS